MKRRVSLVVLFAFWGLLPPTLLAVDQKTVTDRIKQIQMMSKLDRDRLDRNIQAFQGLSNDQKAQYRSLHDELAIDRAQAGGLSALLQTYTLWVQTLTPAQRDELQQTTDPAQKLALVRRFKEEHEHPKASPEVAHEDALPHPNSKFHFPPKAALDSKDLAAVIKVIVDHLPTDRMKPDFNQPPLDKYLPIIKVSSQLSANMHDWPEETLMQRMAAAVRNKESASIIGSKTGAQREPMIRLMLLGILKQANESIRYPSQEERIQVHENLSPAERQRIMTHHRGDEVERLITQKYFEMKGDDAYSKLPAYRRQVIEMFERLEVQAPPALTRPKQRPTHGKG